MDFLDEDEKRFISISRSILEEIDLDTRLSDQRLATPDKSDSDSYSRYVSYVVRNKPK